MQNSNIVVNTPYKLIIDYNNGEYNITVIDMNDNSSNSMKFNEKKLTSNNGFLCIGGSWPNKPIEKFIGKIDYVDITSPQLQPPTK